MPEKKPNKTSSSKGLPNNPEAERFVLGSILLNADLYPQAADRLHPEDFSLQKHQLIYTRMRDVFDAGGRIDRLTVANELKRNGELEACGGISYLVSLDDGLPRIPNLDNYVSIVKEKSVLRLTIFAAQKILNKAASEEHKPGPLLSSALHDLVRIDIEANDRSGALSAEEIMLAHPGGVAGFCQQGIKPGISSGFHQIDEAINGLQEESQVVIAGSTAMGKSSFTMAICKAVAENKHPAVIFSMEMSKEQVLARLICSEAEVPLKFYLRGELMADQRRKVTQAVEKILDLPLYIDDTPSVAPGELMGKVARMVMEKKVRVWALDYLQIVDWQSGRGGLEFRNEYEAFTYISRLCKLINRRFHTTGLIVSQLSRSGTKKVGDPRPKLSDLRGSGAIEQDADVAILLFRPEVYQPGDPSLRGVAEAIIAKARMGETGTKMLGFRSSWTKFSNEGDS